MSYGTWVKPTPTPTPACDACHLPFTPLEWDDRHYGHEAGCPKDGTCDCNLIYHAGCCPDCNKRKPK